MTSVKFLDYKIVLLLAEYGKEAVFNALARKLDLPPENLETLLKEIGETKPAPRNRVKAHQVDPIETMVAQHPQKAEQLRTLYTRFLNRTFLPELRDVKRFLEQHSQNPEHMKSRAKSLPKLFKLLADLNTNELDNLCAVRQSVEYSSLGIISDEILRRENEQEIDTRNK